MPLKQIEKGMQSTNFPVDENCDEPHMVVGVEVGALLGVKLGVAVAATHELWPGEANLP